MTNFKIKGHRPLTANQRSPGETFSSLFTLPDASE
jgi:hypothetical protein